VGRFALVSKVVPTAPAVGEPVTWTLELTGTGNWPDISGLPQREVSNDFSVVQPKSKRTLKDKSLFEGTLTEDVVLIPTKPGRYTLGSLRFTYFDTASGTYKTIATDPVTVNVGPGAAPAATAAPGGPVQFSLSPQPQAQPAAPVFPASVPPVTPDNLPRDPLAESGRGYAPMATGSLVCLCLLSSVLVPLPLWLILAALRSRTLDPSRRRRAARAELGKILAELRDSSLPAPRSALLRQWQDQTAALWEVPHAAPGALLLHACISLRHNDSAAVWAALWHEADRTLHGKDVALPGDWLTRAAGALQAVKVPGWPVLSLFAPHHLLPFLGRTEELKSEGLNQLLRVGMWLVVLFSLSALPPSAMGAETAADAYRRGDFAAAEQDWQAAVKAVPSDWVARHNLGLALSQQDRWAEATGQWTGAFLLNARHDTMRWDLALGLQRSGMAPPELVEFSRGEGRYALARSASPAEWQFALVGASLLIAAALVVLLLQGYGRFGAWARPTALATILLAMLLAAAATFSLRTYGPLADPEAVLVWRPSTLRSIPTEADTAQKSSSLSAGSLAVTDKTFLGWSRLVFTGGQTGWVRNEDLVHLYR
ncbi:MAG: BatD family protein, partial [Opitutales bacterium]